MMEGFLDGYDVHDYDHEARWDMKASFNET